MKTDFSPEVGECFYYEELYLIVERKTKNSNGDRFLHSKGERYLLESCQPPIPDHNDVIDALELLKAVDNPDAANAVAEALAATLPPESRRKAWAMLNEKGRKQFLKLKEAS
ncbi:MAG: hypothetical protein ACRCYP_03565 [Alphaproteobacteria bacterium]